MDPKEVRQARAKVRDRERGIWTDVERIGREARAADVASVKATAKPEEATVQKRGEAERA